MIKVIAIEREYGSGGGGIAQALADRLEWTLWDQEITRVIARRLKCDVKAVEEREERLDPTFYRLVKVFMRGSYEDSYTGGGMDLLDSEHLARVFEEVVKDIALKGNAVIVGRGATWFLRGRPDVFQLFIFAPYEEKLRRILKRGRSRKEAEDLLATVDRERAAFVKKYYNMDWPHREIYHLMLNSKVGDEAVLDTVLHEIKLLDKTAVAV